MGWREANQHQYTARAAYWRARETVRSQMLPAGRAGGICALRAISSPAFASRICRRRPARGNLEERRRDALRVMARFYEGYRRDSAGMERRAGGGAAGAGGTAGVMEWWSDGVVEWWSGGGLEGWRDGRQSRRRGLTVADECGSQIPIAPSRSTDLESVWLPVVPTGVSEGCGRDRGGGVREKRRPRMGKKSACHTDCKSVLRTVAHLGRNRGIFMPRGARSA